MTILINVPRLDLPGGVTNFYRVLQRHLGVKQHFEVGGKSGESGPFTIVWRLVSDYWQFHRTLAPGTFSLVHLNPSFKPKSLLRDAGFVLIARAHAVPVLVLFHGWDESFQATVQRRFCWLFRFVFDKAGGFVVLAEDFRQKLKSMGVTSPVYRNTTCIDDSCFVEQAQSGDSVNHEMATSGSPAGRSTSLHVLFLSRLVPGKGLITAIQAFAVLKRDAPAACMTIAGDGPERHAAERLVENEGIPGVRFLGHVEGEAKERAFREASLFLLTSESEGMPTTVIEAMAYGLPVVTSAVGGLKDFFRHGTMGFMTDSREPRDFAGFMIKLSGDAELLSRMAAYNCAYARENFAASKVADRLNSIYDDIVRQDRLKKTGSRWHTFRRRRMESRIRGAGESQLKELNERYLNAGGTQERWAYLLARDKGQPLESGGSKPPGHASIRHE